REIAFLVAGLVSNVAARIADVKLAPGVPVALVRLDAVHAGVLRGLVLDTVEDKELGLGSKVSGVANTGRFEVGLGLLGNVARVASIGGASDRIGDVADEAERWIFGERIHYCGVRVGDYQHVARVDRLPSANRRAVEAQPFIEGRFVLELGDRGSEMLPRAEQ